MVGWRAEDTIGFADDYTTCEDCGHEDHCNHYGFESPARKCPKCGGDMWRSPSEKKESERLRRFIEKTREMVERDEEEKMDVLEI